MKDDIRTLVEQVGQTPVPDQWDQIQGRAPSAQAPEPPRRRLAAALIAVVVAVVAFTFAFEAYRDGSPPADGPAISASPLPGPSLTGAPRIAGKVQLPANTTGGDLAVGAGSVWVVTYQLKQDGENSLIRIDPITDQITATIPILQAGGVAANDDAVWVTDPGVLDRIDPETNSIVATVDLPADPSTITATSSDVWAVVVDSDGGSLVRVDQATNQIVAEIPLGPSITDYQNQVLAGAGSVWVLGVRWNGKDQASESAAYGGDLIRVDPATNQVSARIPVDGFGMTVGDDAVWVKFPQDGVFDSYNEDWLWTKVDATTGEPSAPFKMDTRNIQLVTPEALWSVDYVDSANVRVMRLDPATHEIEARSVPIRSYASSAVVDPSTGSVWIPTVDTITRVDISSQPDG